jgi:alkylation response protein AidB-like acyl-CoA dehydrogenase
MAIAAVDSPPWFGLGEDHQLILEQVERFAEREFFPLQQRMDDDEWWPETAFPALGANGYLGVTVPAELGGAGLDFFTSRLVLQAVARWNPAIFDLERTGLSFMILGMCGRALELSVDYAKSRRQFGQAIGEFQMVQGMVADIYAELESLRSFTYHVGAEVNTLAHGEARSHVHKRAAAVVLQAGLVLMRIVDRAVQIHGGAGYIWEMEVNRLYRAGKLLQIGAGTTEIRRLIIARELLGR